MLLPLSVSILPKLVDHFYFVLTKWSQTVCSISKYCNKPFLFLVVVCGRIWGEGGFEVMRFSLYTFLFLEKSHWHVRGYVAATPVICIYLFNDDFEQILMTEVLVIIMSYSRILAVRTWRSYTHKVVNFGIISCLFGAPRGCERMFSPVSPIHPAYELFKNSSTCYRIG